MKKNIIILALLSVIGFMSFSSKGKEFIMYKGEKYFKCSDYYYNNPADTTEQMGTLIIDDAVITHQRIYDHFDCSQVDKHPYQDK